MGASPRTRARSVTSLPSGSEAPGLWCSMTGGAALLATFAGRFSRRLGGSGGSRWAWASFGLEAPSATGFAAALGGPHVRDDGRPCVVGARRERHEEHREEGGEEWAHAAGLPRAAGADQSAAADRAALLRNAC